MDYEAEEEVSFDSSPLAAMFGDIFEGGMGSVEYSLVSRREHTPSIDARYVYELEDVRCLLMWVNERTKYARNLMISGPTGSGKTQLIFQFAARTGREVYRYSCHERTDFSELLGNMVILGDGSTSFQDGPLVQAFEKGGIFLLDEANAARPGTLIGMNGVLDGGESLVIPGSNRIVKRHEQFRIAVTGNSLDRDDTASAFRGTQTMNAAFLDRFISIEKGYLPALVEARAVNDFLIAAVNDFSPGMAAVPGKLSTTMVEFANNVRGQFRKGEVETTISTRGLFALAETVAMRWPKVMAVGSSEVLKCAKVTLFNKAPPATRIAFEKTLTVSLGTLSFAQATPGDPDEDQIVPSGVANNDATTSALWLNFMVNPDRSGSGPAFWGWLEVPEDATSGPTGMAKGERFPFNGTFRPCITRFSAVKTAWDISRLKTEKAGKGYQAAAPILLQARDKAHAETTLRQVVSAVAAIRDANQPVFDSKLITECERIIGSEVTKHSAN